MTSYDEPTEVAPEDVFYTAPSGNLRIIRFKSSNGTFVWRAQKATGFYPEVRWRTVLRATDTTTILRDLCLRNIHDIPDQPPPRRTREARLRTVREKKKKA